MELFKLWGSIMVDSAEAEKSISNTGKKADSLGDKLGKGLKTAAKWGAGLTAAATAVGGAMVASAKATAGELDVIDKASQRMDVTAETYQKLAYAAGLSGVEMSTMEKAAKALAASGSELTLDQAIEQIQAVGDDSERAALAAQLFGDTVAYNMTPLINAGAGSMAEMGAEAEALGLVMSGDTVAAGASMNDMFSKVEQSVGALKNGLVSEFMPYVMQILQWVIDNMPVITQTVSSVMKSIMPIVKPILDGIMALLPPMLNAIKGFIDWLTPYITPVINGIVSFVQGVGKLLHGDISGFIDGIKKGFSDLGGAMFGIGKDIFNSLWNGIKDIWGSISSWVSEKVSWLTDKLAFWRKGNNEMSGGNANAHASGLPFVPYDNYPALLHRGEAVVNAQDAKELRNTNNSTVVNLTVNGGAGQDVRELAEIIMQEIEYATKRNGAVFA